MQDFEIKPGWKRRVVAALLACFAVFSAFEGPLSARVLAGAALISAYDLAFIPSPPLNLRLGEIYAMARKGWRMSWASKILSAVMLVLVITSVYLQWQGR